MLHVKIYKKVQAEARSLDPDSFHYTRQLNVRLGDSTQGRQRHPFTYYHPISIWAAKFLCDSSTGTARFVVLHFILLHRCWFFFFRDGRQDPLPAKRLQLALLQWPRTRPTVSQRCACKSNKIICLSRWCPSRTKVQFSRVSFSSTPEECTGPAEVFTAGSSTCFRPWSPSRLMTGELISTQLFISIFF